MPKIEYAPVRYLRSTTNYTWLHLVGVGSPVLVSRTLKYVLANHYPHLVRVDRQFAVDLAQISAFVKNSHGKGSYVVLHDQTMLPVSRRQRNQFNATWRAYQSRTEPTPTA